jgi:hypothetical protein
MGKVFLADVIGESGIRCLLADGKMLKFHFNGTCIGEFPISYNVASMQEVEVISLLVSGSNIELGFNINQVFGKTESSKGLAEINQILTTLQGLVFAGKVQNSLDSIAYNQYIYVFIRGSINQGMLA